MDPLVALLLFVLFGLVVGAYGTLIGAGGGFIIVPVLLLVLHWPHEKAVGTSLVVVAANATSGSVAYWRQKRVDFRTGWQFALATVPGAIGGSYIVDLINGRTFYLVFGVLLIAVSIYLMWRPEKPSSEQESSLRPAGPPGWGWTVRHIVDSRGEAFNFGFSTPWGVLLSFGVGFLSSILGIGGGIVHVPALVTLFGFPAHIATATSHFILSISTITGSVSHFLIGNVELGPAAAMGLGAAIGAQIGGALSHRVQGRWIIRGLAAALTLVGARLIIG
ncbi:MAG: sulfite exporter TauE/SafE family protein [Chloroflexota bacterium]|nr:sulfite exporter TauE/SafE family protein [Chloroflexota bacterium]